MGKWIAEVEGEKFDTEEFPRWFPTGDDVYAVAEGEQVFLAGPALDACKDQFEAVRIANGFLDDFFPVILLIQGNIRRPSITTVVRVDDDGKRCRFSSLSSYCVSRSKAYATLTDPASPPAPTVAQSLLRAAQSSRHLQTALSLLALPGRTWSHLYRCVEEVEAFLRDASIGSTAAKAGLCSSNELERFTRTANASGTAGLDARHPLGKFEPPSNPMSFNEACDFVVKVTHGALQKALSLPTEREAE